MEPELFYFGCWDTPGHFLFSPGGVYVRDGVLPFTMAELDSGFAPLCLKMAQDETVVKVTHRSEWTVMAMWDRSFDERYGSNAAFIAPGERTEAEMWERARRLFPKIAGRLKAGKLATGAQ